MKFETKNLRKTDLCDADLCGANLSSANFCGANLSDAYFCGANLSGANFCGANLSYANLRKTDFCGANLTDTCLDPTNIPNSNVSDFKQLDDSWCIGYRTRNSKFINPEFVYKLGGLYEAPVFSTSDTVCHPGLYINPTKNDGDITVIFRPWECHKAGSKYRVTWFIVWDE